MTRKTERIRITPEEKALIEQIRYQSNSTSDCEPEIIYEYKKQPLYIEEGKSRVLVIGDLHCPFDLDDYLDHCIQTYEDFDCDTVILMGDEVDHHYSSYHDTDPDGYGAGEELQRAIDRLQRYYEAFPKATVIIGNHTRMVRRKAFSGGVPKAWIKEYKEVLEVPQWEFVNTLEIDNVIYVHGEGGQARTRIKSEHQSIVQGHIHTSAYIDWIFNSKQRIFGMQVGTGINFDSYAFAYAKAGKKPAVSCGVVLNGTHPFLIPMEL